MTDYPKKRSRGSRSLDGYTVEARYNFDRPMTIAEQIFDNRWREVKTYPANFGVPIGMDFDVEQLKERGLLSYPAAQAIRWWLHACAHSQIGISGLCMETKLIKHRVEIRHECMAVSEHKIIGGDDRSSVMPDYGATKTDYKPPE